MDAIKGDFKTLVWSHLVGFNLADVYLLKVS